VQPVAQMRANESCAAGNHHGIAHTFDPLLRLSVSEGLGPSGR
jgi:hypothetical protein